MPKPQTLDLSYLKAGRIQPLVTNNIILTLIGCGGTGSWLAPSLARIAYVLREQGKHVQLTFIDPDTIEDKNIPRQNFCAAEIGMNKAVALAARFSAAWGVEILYKTARFQAETTTIHHYVENHLEVLIGCVDNAAARKAIHQNLARSRENSTWWLDCGNTEHAGQVLIGNALVDGSDGSQPQHWLTDKICVRVPSPAVQCPDLLIPRPEEKAKHNLSCADIQIANAQSLAINQVVAAHATDLLLRFLNGTLTRQAMYFDLNSGSARSVYVTRPETKKRKVARV